MRSSRSGHQCYVAQVEVDLGVRSLFDRRQFRVLLLLVCLGAAIGSYYGALIRESARLRPAQLPTRTQLASMTKERADRSNDGSSEMLAAGQGVISRLSVPWPALLQALEESTTDDVAILRIDPDPTRGELKVTANAVDIHKAVKYASSLQSSAVLSHVYIGSQRAAPADPSHPIQLVFLANWNSASRPLLQLLTPTSASTGGSL
jgi:hypothetical protein